MGNIYVGLNTEFSRSSDKPFEWAVEKTAEMGYEYIEPMVHFGRELMSEAGYFHTVSMFDDPYRIKEACDKAGLKISALQAHGPLGTPVGCACGGGVIDWTRVIEIVRRKTPRDIVFSVECGTPDQARSSLRHLKELLR